MVSTVLWALPAPGSFYGKRWLWLFHSQSKQEWENLAYILNCILIYFFSVSATWAYSYMAWGLLLSDVLSHTPTHPTLHTYTPTPSTHPTRKSILEDMHAVIWCQHLCCDRKIYGSAHQSSLQPVVWPFDPDIVRHLPLKSIIWQSSFIFDYHFFFLGGGGVCFFGGGGVIFFHLDMFLPHFNKSATCLPSLLVVCTTCCRGDCKSWVDMGGR